MIESKEEGIDILNMVRDGKITMSRMSMVKDSIYSMSSVDIERDVKKLTYVGVMREYFDMVSVKPLKILDIYCL